MISTQNTIKPLQKTGPVADEIKRTYLATRQSEEHELVKESTVLKCFYVFYPIAEFLSPIEVMNLTKVHSHLDTKETTKWFIDRFKDNLYELMNNSGHRTLATNLKVLTKPWPFVISGSIALQALLSVKWDKFDIDIYGDEDGTSAIQTLLSNTGYQNFYVRGDTNDVYIQIQATQTLKSVKDWYNYIPNVNEYPRSTVQVIELLNTVQNPANCVDSFDLNIVKNSWNGQTVSINNSTTLIKRIATVSPHIAEILGTMGTLTGSLVKPFNRLYALQTNRILTINLNSWNLNHSDSIVVAIFAKIFNRFRKYAHRGFVIQCNGKTWGKTQINNILNRLYSERTTYQRSKLVKEILKTTWEFNQ